jgi:type I restriction enzyme, S subunit
MANDLASPLGPLPPDWRVASIKDIATKVGSGATPKGGESVYLEKRLKYVLVRSQNVYDRHFDDSALVFISDSHARELRGAELQPGDLLLNITGDGVTFARACMTPYSVLPACVNQHVSIIRLNPEACLPSYLLAYLTHPTVKTYIESFNAGGSRRAITKGNIESFRVPLPPIAQQKKIGEILCAFDDKIALNRRMNQTLEAMARAIFKSWFVDFKPARKGHSLFSTSLVESQLGLIPKGWEIKELSSFITVVDCLHTQKPKRRAEGETLLQLSNIKDDGLLDMSDKYLISEENYKEWTSRMEAQPGDCVITNVGRVGAVAQVPRGYRAALGRNMTGLRCKAHFPGPTFLIECLRSSKMREEIERKTDSGTILDSLNVRNIPRLRSVVPPQPVLEAFERVCRPLRTKMEHNQEENLTLTALRDTLLPKLLSGEIRLREAEKAKGDVL